MLDATPRSAGLIGLRDPILRLKRAARNHVYLKTDTHWTHRSGLELVRGVLGRLGGRVQLRPSDVKPDGTPDIPGDLTRLLGENTPERRELLKIDRSPRAPKVPGRTVFVQDSFGNAMAHLLKPYFDDLETGLLGQEEGRHTRPSWSQRSRAPTP